MLSPTAIASPSEAGPAPPAFFRSTAPSALDTYAAAFSRGTATMPEVAGCVPPVPVRLSVAGVTSYRTEGGGGARKKNASEPPAMTTTAVQTAASVFPDTGFSIFGYDRVNGHSIELPMKKATYLAGVWIASLLLSW